MRKPDCQLLIRRYRTNWWAAWMEGNPVVVLGRNYDQCVRRAAMYFGIEIPESEDGLA